MYSNVRISPEKGAKSRTLPNSRQSSGMSPKNLFFLVLLAALFVALLVPLSRQSDGHKVMYHELNYQK